ncbi:MAG TPA: L,D-transpeptidase [Anaerolineaceae bacterium]|nr:L,D-transpeptidase [Anaerolineaceae bacterium]
MNNLFFDHLSQISRREFLRLAGTGMLAGLFTAFIPSGNKALAGDTTPRIGRVLNDAVAVYEKPTYTSKFIKMFYKDLIVSIGNITVGDDEPVHNRVWYFVNDLGYAHSGGIQPVQININSVVETIPKNGLLAELTVPFTDTYKDPENRDKVVFRIYYSAVFWVFGFLKSSDGKAWYKIWDDKFKFFVYANAAHLRLLTNMELEPIAPEVPANSKKIQVNRTEQTLIAYQDDQPVYMTRTATGARFIDGNFTTPAGRYILHRKRPSRHMADGDFAAPKTYDLPGVPWVTYLTQKGVALHGTYWHNDFGQPHSHGCINVSSEAAKWLYLWTNPVVPFDQDYWEEDTGTILDVV